MGAAARPVPAAHAGPPPRLDSDLSGRASPSPSASWDFVRRPGKSTSSAALALLVAFLSASQDIVIDAYRVDTIPVSERGLAAAAQSFGYRTAAMLAGAVLVLIAAHMGWRLAFLIVACLMAATTVGDALGAGAGSARPAAPHLG